jgi:hypothetical protein
VFAFEAAFINADAHARRRLRLRTLASKPRQLGRSRALRRCRGAAVSVGLLDAI